MEIQLQELIDKIKSDGVTAAEKEADEIIENAKKQADKIINDAKKEASELLFDAKEDNARLVKVSEDAIRQAGRNLLLSFRESVNNELSAIIGEKVNEAYAKENLADIITKVIVSLTENSKSDDIAILLNSSDINKLENALLASLKEKSINGITLTPNDDFTGGFRIAVNDGTAYYDYSAKSVAEMLSTYLNPRVTELMKEAE